jgi:hypothetical protein
MQNKFKSTHLNKVTPDSSIAKFPVSLYHLMMATIVRNIIIINHYYYYHHHHHHNKLCSEPYNPAALHKRYEGADKSLAL